MIFDLELDIKGDTVHNIIFAANMREAAQTAVQLGTSLESPAMTLWPQDRSYKVILKKKILDRSLLS